MNRGWFKDAIQKYLAAYAKDASSRGDRRMRRDLLRLMDNPAAQERAANAIQTIYGAEALADIERMLASPGLDPVGRGHLEALRDRLHR